MKDYISKLFFGKFLEIYFININILSKKKNGNLWDLFFEKKIKKHQNQLIFTRVFFFLNFLKKETKCKYTLGGAKSNKIFIL